MLEPREEGGKEFWARFDLNKWLEDAKEVGEILRKAEAREDGLFTKGIETCGEALEIVKNVRRKIEAALPKKEGEGWEIKAPVDYDKNEQKCFWRGVETCRTAVEKIIEGLKREYINRITAENDEIAAYNMALRDLKEKIKE